jgi:diguanylate cyclase (GGDEF)-like protein
MKRDSRDEIGDLTESFNKMAEELDSREKALIKAEKLATRDGLTGIYNHRFFQESLAKELKRSTRHKLQFSLIFLDLDHFKNYNDTNGHLEGDFLLKELSKMIGDRLRTNDILARYGGEEFVIILPETTKEEGGKLAEELRILIEEHPFPGDDKQPLGKVTASMGVSAFPEDGKKPHDIIDRADQLLYKAKGKGRNTVCL